MRCGACLSVDASDESRPQMFCGIAAGLHVMLSMWPAVLRRQKTSAGAARTPAQAGAAGACFQQQLMKSTRMCLKSPTRPKSHIFHRSTNTSRANLHVSLGTSAQVKASVTCNARQHRPMRCRQTQRSACILLRGVLWLKGQVLRHPIRQLYQLLYFRA